ncbi:hypothetical protein [Nonomuraea sp. NPDC048826]|uniref:hypothetical protein n=1 Tax=Nonomuraea sp. NPDC048826 TaxID=3364347 RepID=UPI003723B3B1
MCMFPHLRANSDLNDHVRDDDLADQLGRDLPMVTTGAGADRPDMAPAPSRAA